MNATRNRKLALTALFTAASLVVSFIQVPIFPAAPWLHFDPSIVVCLLAGLAFGPKIGAAVTVISWLPRIFYDPWGMLMADIVALSVTIIAGLVYRKRRTYGVALVGMILGAIVAVVLACGANLVITPLYTAVSMQEVMAMIVPILLPFNALKMLITVVAGAVLIRPVENLMGTARDAA